MTAKVAMAPAERFPLLILFLVNPLLLFPFVTDQALIRWLLVALFLAIAVVASVGVASRMWVHRMEVWPLAGLCILIVYHLVRGAPVAEAVRWLIIVGLGAMTYLYCRVLGAADRDESITLLVMAGGAVGAYAVLQAAGWDVVPYVSESWMYRVVTTFGHRNFTATFLVVVLLCGFGLLRRNSVPAGRWFLLSMGLTFLGLLATGSRFPILAATVALVVFSGGVKHLRWIMSAGLLVFAVWVVVIVGRGELNSVLMRTETLFLRADLYRSMAPLMTVDPVIGLGPGGFSRAIPEVVGASMPEDIPGLVFLHAHLLPAELLIDFGLVGLVLALLFMLPVWVSLIRRGHLGWFGWAHICWLVINLYDVSFFGYAGWVTLWPVLAFLRSEDGPRQVARAEQASIGWLPRGFMTGVLVVAVFILAPMVRSSHHCFRGAAGLAAENASAAVSAFEQAEAIWPLAIKERYQYAVAILRSGETPAAIGRLLAVESDAPGFSAVRYNLAMAYARLGRLSEALLWIDQHLELYPNDAAALDAGARLEKRASATELY